jgi:polysaccharide chain length determinant protein (PEP-CTERM system associated)
MLPGKKYAPEDYVKIAWRWKWLILVVTLATAGGAFVYGYTLPNRYRSEALIMIVPQRVPTEYVRATVTTPIGTRLAMISQQLLTRTRLERMIQDFDLYRNERDTMIMEDVIALMRRDIRMQPARAPRRGETTSSFSVGYDSSDPRTAMRVAEELASLFVKENLEVREVLADSTNEFLGTQLEQARQRLVETEKKLEAFRLQNAGRLPTQAPSNLQILSNAQNQLQALYDATNRDRDRLLFLDRALADMAAAAVPAADAALPAATVGPAAQQLATARATLRNLEARLRPAHPDIGRLKRQIAELELKADAEALRQPLSPVVVPTAAAAQAERLARNREAEIRQEMVQIQIRIDGRKSQETRLQQTIAAYNSRLEAAPRLESDMIELTRDYGTLQAAYTSLLTKSEESKMALSLERRQIGEQFRVLDNARLPQRPISPNRGRINMMGLLAGLGLSFALVALLAYRDTTLKTDEDVVVSLALPVLAVIPAMLTTVERRRARRRRLVAVTASIVLVVSGAAVAVWQLQLIDVVQRWVR